MQNKKNNIRVGDTVITASNYVGKVLEVYEDGRVLIEISYGRVYGTTTSSCKRIARPYKYKGHLCEKIIDEEVIGNSYYKITRDGNFITVAWTLSNAKEFIDTFDGKTYNYNVLC